MQTDLGNFMHEVGVGKDESDGGIHSQGVSPTCSILSDKLTLYICTYKCDPLW